MILSEHFSPEKYKSFRRWYQLHPHPIQLSLVWDIIRFKLVSAARRAGKTENAKRELIKACFRYPAPYFAGAPTRDQVKRIFWDDLKTMSFKDVLDDMAPELAPEFHESDLRITYPTGASIQLVGLDKPQRLEGSYWAGGIIDEMADVKPEAWYENISPALDTVNPLDPDYRAWCWLMSVPDGLNHFYDLYQYAETAQDPNWKAYTWMSKDILPPDVIDSARSRLSPRQFRQEYEASFESAQGRIYDTYSRDNYTTRELIPSDLLHWCHDFNYSPMSSAICTRVGDTVYVLDEIILHSANARMVAEVFVDKFKNHMNREVLIYGDPSGTASEKHGLVSNYREIENVLRMNGFRVERRVKSKAPGIVDRQNSVRAKIKSMEGDVRLYVNTARCPYTTKGLANTMYKPGSTRHEQESDYQHITTAIGYFIDYEFPVSYDKIEHHANLSKIPRYYIDNTTGKYIYGIHQ